MQKIIVDKKSDGQKLRKYLTSKYKNLNINTLYKALRKKDIRINGKRISDDCVLYEGDEIVLYISDELLYGNNLLKISVIYEDDNIGIFNKPKNIEVVGKESYTELLQKKYEFIKPCHRIDRNTDGLILYAKDSEILDIILKLFKESKIEKHYIACCYGIAKKEECLEAYLFKDRKKSFVYISDEYKKGYSKIKTSYKTLYINQEKNLSLLDVNLHTGRTHQIRAHLAHIGLPIIGDGKYGSYKVNQEFKISSQLLSSYSLSFKQIDNERLSYLNNKTFKLNNIPYKYYFTNGR